MRLGIQVPQPDISVRNSNEFNAVALLRAMSNASEVLLDDVPVAEEFGQALDLRDDLVLALALLGILHVDLDTGR